MLKSIILLISILTLGSNCLSQDISKEPLRVKHTKEFEISGDGSNKAWESAKWNNLTPADNQTQKTRFKILYSETGIYFLFHNEDESLTATMTKDFDRLWLEDVNEVFLWPDTTATIYFEYEISPLNYELSILVPNFDGKFLGWLPWEYEGKRKTKHLTSVVGGEKVTGSNIRAWVAEFFIPYALLNPLPNVPPKSGMVWKGNMYRIDHDNGKAKRWSWRKTDSNFHQYSRFGKMIFE
jgi:hypothetical protein